MKPLLTKGQTVYVYNYDSELFSTHIVKKDVMPVHAVEVKFKSGKNKGKITSKHHKIKLGRTSFYVQDLVDCMNKFQYVNGSFLVYTNKKAFQTRVAPFFKTQLQERLNRCDRHQKRFMRTVDEVGQTEKYIAKLKNL